MEKMEMRQSLVGRLEGVLHARAMSIMFLILRFAFGYMMLHAGLSKLTAGGWTAAGFLSYGSGPFAGLFASMAGSGVVDGLVIWGEILIGAALILGLFLRFACFLGALMMVLFFLPYLPPEHGWVSQQIVYLLVFVAFMFSGAGYLWGLDSLLKKAEQRYPILRYVLG